jgi:predicted patatin/cPLA2 family phospholipase
MTLKVKEAKELAKYISETNTALWDAVSMVENLLSDKFIKEMVNNVSENEKEYEQIAKEYLKLNKNDDEFINVGIRARSLDDFDQFVGQMTEFIERLNVLKN